MPNSSDPIKRREQRVREDRARKPQTMGKKAWERAEEFLRIMQNDPDLTIKEGAAKVGVTEAAVGQWRKISSKYRARHDLMMKRRREGYVYPPCPFTPETREKYFADDYDEPVNPRHLLVAIDFINRLQPGQFGCMLFPPEHAKTTIGEDWLTCDIADDPELRCGVISKSRDEASKRLGTVQNRMTDRDFYGEFISTYGPFEPPRGAGKPWSATKMSVARKSPRQRDFSLQASGIRVQIQGRRIDRALIDDPVDDQNYGEYEQQGRYIRQSVNTRLGKTGIGLMIGTRQDEIDLYKHLMDEDFFDAVLILPAQFERDYSYTLMDGTVISWKAGEYLWPERYSEEDYETMRRKAGPRIWELTYQQHDVVGEGQAFPLDLIENCYQPTMLPQVVPVGSVAVAGIDPAATGYTAGFVRAVDLKTKKRRWVDVWNEKDLIGDGGDRVDGLIQFIVGLVETYKVKVLCLEANSAWTLLSSNPRLRTRLAELGCRIRVVKSGRGENDDLAIKQLSVLFANEVEEIPTQAGGKGLFTPAIRQFITWRAGDKRIIKDILKAFQFSEIAARDVSMAGESGESEVVDRREQLPPYLQREIDDEEDDDDFGEAYGAA